MADVKGCDIFWNIRVLLYSLNHMQKTIIIIIVLLAVALGIYYVVTNNNVPNPASIYSPTVSTGTGENAQTGSDNTIGTTSTSTPATSTLQNKATKSVAVDIKNFAFSPATLDIKTGTKVTWTNRDSTSHTVTSDSGGLLNSAMLAPGQTFSYTFNDAGSIRYHCTPHPNMKGVVNVTK